MPRGIPKSGSRQKRADDRRHNRPVQIDPVQAYSVPEVASAIDSSVAYTWKAIRERRITPMASDDSRVRVLGREIIKFNLERAGLSQ